MIGKTINSHTRRTPCLSPLDSLPAIAFHHRATMDRKIATFLCLLTLLNAAQAKEANPNTVDHAGLMQAWDEASMMTRSPGPHRAAIVLETASKPVGNRRPASLPQPSASLRSRVRCTPL